MPFVKFRKPVPNAKPYCVRASVLRRSDRRTPAGMYGLRLRFGADVAALAGFRAGQSVALLWGDGDDFGRVQLRPDSGRYAWKLGLKDGTLMIHASALPRTPLKDAKGRRYEFIVEPRRSVICPHVVEPRGLVVVLPPEWFKPADAAVRKVA